MGQPTLAFLRQSAHKFVLGNGSLTTQAPVHGRWHHGQVGMALYQCQAKNELCGVASCPQDMWEWHTRSCFMSCMHSLSCDWVAQYVCMFNT